MRLPDRDRSRAVLIGVGEYTSSELPDVPAVHNNVRDLGRELTRARGGAFHPEHCVEITDPVDGHSLGRQLLHAARQAEDVLLVYYSGHGLVGTHKGELFLALAETDPDAVFFSAMAFEGVRRAFLDSPAKNRILLLDCCFSGRAIGGHLSDEVSALIGQIDISGTYVLTSAAANEPALVEEGARHTAFTGELISLLREGGRTLDGLYRELHRSLTGRGVPAPQRCGTETAQELVLVAGPGPARPEPKSPSSGEAPSAEEAARLAAAGDLEGAVAVYRSLAKTDARRYGPALATGLRALSSDMQRLDRLEGARAALEEAARVYRALNGEEPSAFCGHAAAVLGELGRILTRLGRRAKALAVQEEAAELLRGLVKEGASEKRQGLAQLLSDISDNLIQLEKAEQALVTGEELVSIYRELVAEDPARFNATFADELLLLRSLLAEVERFDEAFRVSDEAVDIYRVLAEEDLEQYGSALAEALMDLGVALTDLEAHAEALEVDSEAVELLRPMARTAPETCRPLLAQALKHKSIDLRELGREKAAQAVDEEAKALVAARAL